jgi:predicted nucleotidyltransferase
MTIMNSRDLNIARELKRRLAAQTNLVNFMVYGSRARGDAGESSDLDVFVEVESLDSQTKERIYELTWEVGFKNFMVISPIIVSRNELENTALRSSPLICNIARDGVAV